MAVNYAAWESSVTYDNGGIVDINWDSAYYIYEFIANPTKRAQIKAAVEAYLASAVVSLVEVKPLYRLYTQSYDNTFFTTSVSEAGYYQNRWNYYFDSGYVNANESAHYVQGYVFKTQQPGTVPLY
ncbi:MAG: hypothetical protein LBV38_05390, partial [Alistipes sp.]|nr:hypothetical protein [Alistipes sp.]